MINVRCFTNLDGYLHTQWPPVIACRPEIGDRVISLDRQKSLYIASITHCYDTRRDSSYLEIELHQK